MSSMDLLARAAGLSTFIAATRCAEEPIEALVALGWRTDMSAGPADRDPDVRTSDMLEEVLKRMPALPPSERQVSVDAVVNAMRLERYALGERQVANRSVIKNAVRAMYYALRPLFPVAFRKHLQRMALRDWTAIPFPRWPVDTSVEEIHEAVWLAMLTALNVRELPFIWFWPDGKRAAAMMTHDIETAAGRDFCGNLIAVESTFGIQSAFEVVPEERYVVPDSFLTQLRDAGCEICLHGLNHDGRLFTSRELFLQRAKKIGEYARNWGAKGFRAPVMYRNLDWLDVLDVSYDMSVPNVAHLDPQRGGCCTVFPYMIGELLELPLTTTQDYQLFNVLNLRTTKLWQSQIENILGRHGLASFIVHPDYITEAWAMDLYARLLEMLVHRRDQSGLWIARPGEIDDWWRMRARMHLSRNGGGWRIVGAGCNRARLAFVSMDQSRIRYRIDDIV